MKTISVVCQKGGVGKTTTVINIASVLANKGLKTLIIDTDPQGNVSTYLNQEKSNTDNTTTTDILDGEKNINPLKVIDNLYLIPSDIDIKKHNSEKIIGGSKLKKIYENENINTFDIVLIDTPPTMSSLVLLITQTNLKEFLLKENTFSTSYHKQL